MFINIPSNSDQIFNRSGPSWSRIYGW